MTTTRVGMTGWAAGVSAKSTRHGLTLQNVQAIYPTRDEIPAWAREASWATVANVVVEADDDYVGGIAVKVLATW